MRCVSTYLSEASSEPYQTSKRELLTKIVNGFWHLATFAKITILDVCQGSECVLLSHSEQLFPNMWVSQLFMIASSRM